MYQPTTNPIFTSDKWPLVVIPATEGSPAQWAYYITETKALVGHVEVRVNRKGVKKLTCKCDGLWRDRSWAGDGWMRLDCGYLTDIGIIATKVGQEIKRQSNA